MAAKTDLFEVDLLQLLFQNVDLTGIGDAGGLLGSVAPGVFHISLHVSEPGDSGDQTTGEASYTSYARIPVVRSAALWAVSGGIADNIGVISFATCTGGSQTMTHAGIGTDISGTGYLLYYGALTAGLPVSTGVTPSFPIGDLNVQEI